MLQGIVDRHERGNVLAGERRRTVEGVRHSCRRSPTIRSSAGCIRTSGTITSTSPSSLLLSVGERSRRRPSGVLATSELLRSGCHQTSNLTASASSACSRRACRLPSTRTCSPSSKRWIQPTPGIHTGTCRGSVSTLRCRGAGLGSSLMQACLDVVDASHLPVYLETPNPRTIAFYRRHGFSVTGDARSGTCPPMTFMQRPEQ
jgi:Acetyltransferase (GNAT) family